MASDTTTATPTSAPNTDNTDPQGSHHSTFNHYASFPRTSADGMYVPTEEQNAQLPATMKALVLESRDRPMRVDAGYAVPHATAGSAVVRILAASVISYMGDVYAGRRPYPFPTPLVPGTSAVGRVAAVGADATALRPGRLVWIDATVRSRDAPDADCMLSGLFSGMTAGSAHLMAGAWRDSTFAQYARLPLENCFALDEARLMGAGGLGLTPVQLSAFSRLAIPFGGLDDIGVKAGETVIVAPATGPFGSGAVAVALAMGAGRVVALGRNVAALEALAAADGTRGRVVPCVLANDREKDGKALEAALGGEGRKADAYFDISPPAAQDSTHLGSCMLALRAGGRVSFMGGIGGDVALPHMAIMRSGLTIRGTYMYTPAQARRLIQMLEAGLLDLRSPLVAGKIGSFALEQWKEAFDWAAENAGPGVAAAFEPWK